MQKLMSFIIYFAALATSTAHGYLDLNESGELINQGEQRVGFAPQFILNRGGGTNASLFVEAGTSESTSTRATLEGGDVSFNAFVSMKYIPFPHVDQQPAMGIRGGIGIARDNDDNNLYFQVAPWPVKWWTLSWAPWSPMYTFLLSSTQQNLTTS